MTISEHLRAIAEELERHNARPNAGHPVWLSILLDSFELSEEVRACAAAFRRAAALAEKDHTNG